MREASSDTVAPDVALIERLALDAIDALPTEYREAARAVALRVEEFAPEHLLDETDTQDPFELSGLYVGIPLTEKSVADQAWEPDTIWLFRRPILDEWADRGTVPLGALVTHVLVHELAHHFGWTDAEIAQVDRWWE